MGNCGKVVVRLWSGFLLQNGNNSRGNYESPGSGLEPEGLLTLRRSFPLQVIESAVPILKLIHRDSIEDAFTFTDADSITSAVGKSRG